MFYRHFGRGLTAVSVEESGVIRERFLFIHADVFCKGFYEAFIENTAGERSIIVNFDGLKVMR